MKKIISLALVCVLLVGTMFTLASCGTMLFGKYELVISDSNRVAYEFSFNKVTKTTTYGALGFEKTEVTEGKYEITEVEEGKYQITFTWDGETEPETTNFTQGEENGKKYVRIGILTYEKVD